jgi:hypothetical protein
MSPTDFTNRFHADLEKLLYGMEHEGNLQTDLIPDEIFHDLLTGNVSSIPPEMVPKLQRVSIEYDRPLLASDDQSVLGEMEVYRATWNWGGDRMRKNTEKLSLEDSQKLSDNINHVNGILELPFCAIASEHPVGDVVLPIIMDAQDEMKDIEKKIDILTAA